ncbi:hypothetical protein ACF0H5_006784 [Mactra antiquata]
MEPVKVAVKLCNKRMLHQADLRNIILMKVRHTPDIDIWEYLIGILPNYVYIQSFVRVLCECGYRDVAADMYLVYLDIKGRQYSAIKGRSESRRGLRACSRKLKANIHNAPFANREQYLRNLEDQLVFWMEGISSTRTRQVLADLCITVIGASIDAIAITFSTELYKNDIFKRYERLISESSNSTLSKIGLLGRWANACAIAGEFAEAEDYLAQARCLTVFVGPTLEQFNSFYTEIYGRLWQYEKHPSKSLIMSILFWGKIGLKCIEDEKDPYTKAAWKKNFMMRMSLCLLGLGNRTNLIKDAIITREYVQEAGVYILELCKPEIMDTIELRRAMILSILKARWLELNTCFTASSKMYKDAERKATKGNFREIRFINEHIERVANNIKQDSHFDSNTIPTTDRLSANLCVILLKQISIEERGIPSGCSQPDDSVYTVGVQLRHDTVRRVQLEQTHVEPRNIRKMQQLTLPINCANVPTNDMSRTSIKHFCEDILHEHGFQPSEELFALNVEPPDDDVRYDTTEYKELSKWNSAKVISSQDKTSNTSVKQNITQMLGHDYDKSTEKQFGAVNETLGGYQVCAEASRSSCELFAMSYVSLSDSPSSNANESQEHRNPSITKVKSVMNESCNTEVKRVKPLRLEDDDDEPNKYEVRVIGEINSECGNSKEYLSTSHQYFALNNRDESFDNVAGTDTTENKKLLKLNETDIQYLGNNTGWTGIESIRQLRLDNDFDKANQKDGCIPHEDYYLFGEGIPSTASELFALNPMSDSYTASINETECKEVHIKSRTTDGRYVAHESDFTDVKQKVSDKLEKGNYVNTENDVRQVTIDEILNSNNSRGYLAMSYNTVNDDDQLKKYEYGELNKLCEAEVKFMDGKCDNTAVKCVKEQRLDIGRDKSNENYVDEATGLFSQEITFPSSELFAMNYSSANDPSGSITTKCKNVQTPVSRNVNCVSDSGETDVKQIMSHRDSKNIKHESRDYETVNEELHVMGEGIPSWEREPPSGQSTDN